MGEILKAVGEAKQAIDTVKAARDAASGGMQSQDTSDPGVQLTPIDLPGSNLSNQSIDLSQSGVPGVPDNSGGGGIMPYLTGDQPDQSAPPAPTPPPAPVDNPYTPDDNLSNAAASAGSQDDAITVTGDGWKPPAHEGWLGKAMDTLMMLRGRSPAFKDRVDQKNLEAAMRGFQSHPEEAIQRIAQISPATAEHLTQTMSAVSANKALEQQRLDELNQTRTTQLQAQVAAVTGSKNPEAVYAKVLPVLNANAARLGMQPFEDKYDPDKLGFFASSGMSPYQQAAVSHDNAALTAQISNQNVDNLLAKQRLTVEQTNSKTSQYNAQTDRMNAETSRMNATKKPDKSEAPVTKSIFHQDGSVAGTLAPDGMTAALQGPDGKFYAFRLRKQGDINSRVRSPGDDAALQAAMAKAAGQQ